MKENDIENLKNKDKNNTNNMNESNEKVHYEIKFVETDDGYRLEASGDKEALRRLGIGPNMVGSPGLGRRKGRRSQRHRGPGGARRGRSKHRGPGRRASRARHRRAMNQAWQSHDREQPGHPALAHGVRRRYCGPRHSHHAAPGYGRYQGTEKTNFPKKGSSETWNW